MKDHNPARALAHVVMTAADAELIKSGEERKYSHRVSGVGRCMREAVLHGMEVPQSNPPKPEWGTQITFNQGHDAEDRVLEYLRGSGITIACEQMTVESTTPMGIKIPGHIDGIMIIPDGMPMGGYWYLFDVKTISNYGYRMVVEKDKASENHRRQLGIYKHAVVNDDRFEECKGQKVEDLTFNGVQFGGLLVLYHPKERPVVGWGDKKEELDRLHFVAFDVDMTDAEMYLDFFDEIQLHLDDNRLPPIPDAGDEMVWGGYDTKAKKYKARRCNSRWCTRYTVCKQNA